MCALIIVPAQPNRSIMYTRSEECLSEHRAVVPVSGFIPKSKRMGFCSSSELHPCGWGMGGCIRCTTFWWRAHCAGTGDALQWPDLGALIPFRVRGALWAIV